MKAAICLFSVAAFVLGGCATTPHAPKAMVRTELYFGQTKGDGTRVTPKEWKAFLDHEITPRFPNGLTLIPAEGQWRDSRGKLIQEKTWLLTIVHPKGERENRLLEEIRQRYQQRFGQELVLKVASPVVASF